MLHQSIYHTVQRYRTLKTSRIFALPIAILMPHSSCNCRCVMCDIWKDNKNLKQLSEQDLEGLLSSFKKLGTREVLMSGGEALLHPAFFRFCEILRQRSIRVTLLSTGLTLKKNASSILEWVNEVIVSIDGDEALHDAIRNIPGAFSKLRDSVRHIKSLKPDYRITGRTVIHQLNFRNWPDIIRSARDMGLDQISFLPADVSSQAFNREKPWDDTRQHEVMIALEDLKDLKQIIEEIVKEFRTAFDEGFIAESPAKIRKIYEYYAALYGINAFPQKRCNAPWVSTVIEADGSVKPCFFLPISGNIREHSLLEILNSRESISFRKNLDTDTNETCKRCVCYLHLSPGN